MKGGYIIKMKWAKMVPFAVEHNACSKPSLFIHDILAFFFTECCVSSALSCDPPPAEKWVIVRGLPDNDNPILPDSFLRFSCQGPGKFLNGSSVLICGKDGQWDNPFPICEGKPCKIKNIPSDNFTL